MSEKRCEECGVTVATFIEMEYPRGPRKLVCSVRIDGRKSCQMKARGRLRG